MNIWSIFKQEIIGLWGNGKGISLAAIALGWGLLMGIRMVYPVIIPYFETEFGMSLSVAGLLVSVLWFFAAIGQLPSGVLADRYSERTLMAVSVTTVAGALMLVITAPSAILLFVATAIWGLGHSLYPIARITFLSELYAERLGSALGVTMAMGDIGQSLLPPVATVLAAAFLWQAGLGFVIPGLLLAGILIFLFSPTHPSEDSSSDLQSLWEARDVLYELRNPTMGFMTGILFLYMFIWQSFTTFYPTYLTTVKGFSPSTAGILFGFFFAVGVLVKPLAGAAYDRIGMRISLISILLPAVVGFALLPLTNELWILVGITAMISVMLGTGAITQSFLAEAFSDNMKGTGLGVVRTVTAALAATGPVVFGVVADAGYFDEGYFVLALIMAVVVILTFRMPMASSTS